MTEVPAIRRAVPADHQSLLELWERSVRATHAFLTPSDVEALRPLVAEELSTEAIEWWVAGSGGAVIAFLGYVPGSIEGLFVDPAHRGRGAGTALVAHAQELAGGPLRVDVNEQNPAALGFYESRGFEVVGRSDEDSAGRPFPIIHMRRTQSSRFRR